MSELRGWMIYSWVALPTVMYGGYSLLQLLREQTQEKGDAPPSFL